MATRPGVAWTVPILVGTVIDALIGALIAYARIPLDRGHAWHAVDPAGRPHQRHVGSLDQQPATGLLDRAVAALRHPGADFLHGDSHSRHGGLDELIRAGPLDLRGRRRTAKRRAPPGCGSSRPSSSSLPPTASSPASRPVLFGTQLQVIQSTVPPNLELTVITAAVIGGVSILGGTGTVIGATLARGPVRRHRIGLRLRRYLGLLARARSSAC